MAFQYVSDGVCIIDCTTKPGTVGCNGDCNSCEKLKTWNIEQAAFMAAVDLLKELGEYDMMQAYMSAMAEKYPNRMVKVEIKEMPKAGLKKREIGICPHTGDQLRGSCENSYAGQEGVYETKIQAEARRRSS